MTAGRDRLRELVERLAAAIENLVDPDKGEDDNIIDAERTLADTKKELGE